MIYDGKNKFTEWQFSKEQDLESAIQKVRPELFGSSRIYLKIKKLIGKPGYLKAVHELETELYRKAA